MNKKYVFDVDGTLTPSRGRINEDFRLWFTDFCIRNEVYLVTGSDYEKTREQLGDYLLRWPVFVYNCSGSDVWAKGERIRTSEWSLPDDLRSNLEIWLNDSKFQLRTGLHIEERPGAVNFSVVGRNANQEERKLYVEWDTETNERMNIARMINTLYPNIQATVGGDTGIDIYPMGKDKSQILVDFDKENDYILFFGDKMEEGGNDFPLAAALFGSYDGANYKVNDWKHTFEILKRIGD